MSKSIADAKGRSPEQSQIRKDTGITARLKKLADPSAWPALLPGAQRVSSTPEEREAYIHEVRHEIQGWNGTGAFHLVHEIAKHQLKLGVRGDIAEIGVHHGQMLVFLMMMLRSGERAIAIDLFDEQHLNIDRSGHGDRDVFNENVERYVPSLSGELTVIQGDSTCLKPADLFGDKGQGVRLFSVDGGHTRDIVINDLFLAAAGLNDAGVVILDDVFNAYFPGVGDGLSAYISGGADLSRYSSYRNSNRRLAPFAIGCNKVMLAFEPHRKKYMDFLLECPIANTIRGHAIGWGVDGIPVFEL